MEIVTNRRTRIIALSSLLLTAWLAAPAVAAAAQDAAELTEQATQRIQEEEYEEALELADRAIEADEGFWEPWYQRGRALGLMGRMEEAKESLLRAVELNPGFAHGHALAATAARQTEDWETAWDQGVKAYLAGVDQAQAFGNIGAHSTPPDDIEERLAAWKVFIAGIDISELEAQAERPDNQRGGASASGAQQANLATTELGLLERQLRRAISDSPEFGLVPDAGQATYALVISIDSLRDRQPMRMEGYLRLYRLDQETDEPIYYRPVELRDISAAGPLYTELQRYVAQMGNWKDEQGGS